MPRRKAEPDSVDSAPEANSEVEGVETLATEEVVEAAEEVQNPTDDLDFSDGEDEQVADSAASEFFFPFDEEAAAVAGNKVMIYGASGAGKTHFAGTWPRPLFLDLENGMRPVRHMGALRWPGPGETVTDIKQVKEFWKLVRRAVRSAAQTGQDLGFDTIVIDGLNELQHLVMQHVIDSFPARRQYEDQPVQADYGKANRDLLAIVRLFLSLPINVIFTCNEVYHEGDMGGKWGPKMTGRAAVPEIMRLVDLVGRVYTYQAEEDSEITHAVVFEDSPEQYGKDRIGLRQPAIVNEYSAFVEQL